MAEQHVHVSITGMTCASCSRRVEKVLGTIEGVSEACVNLANEQAAITYDPSLVSPDTLLQAVEKAGYGVITEQREFPVTGMTCATCSRRVEKALNKLPGILSANVNLASELATVVYAPAETSWTNIKATVERAGYGVIETDTTDCDAPEDVEAAAREREVAGKRRKLLVGVTLGLPLLFFRCRATLA
jgi:Cu+-exporting ATPase